MDTIALARAKWEEHGWGDVAEGMAAVTSVMRAQQIFQARVDDVLQPFELTFARYEVLMLLHFSSRGSMPVKKASGRLQVHPTSITNAVDRLEGAGLVRRLPHPTDGRATLVEITDLGRETALKATEVLNREVFGRPGLSPRRVSTLVNVLADLRKDSGDF
ncbi:MAG: MarR family transcriptional regulator [Frankiales bacterium]|nr:MarR family transcriptional regulator [Frankiales bacterium]